MTTAPILTPPQVVGRNVRRFREDKEWRLIDLANAINATGVTKWTTARVSEIEAGQRRLTLEEVSALSYVLNIDPVDLFDGGKTEKVQVLGGVVKLSTLRAQFDRALPRPTQWVKDLTLPALDDESRQAATRIGIPLTQFRETAAALWGRSLPEERDSRLEDTEELSARSLQAKRALITRTLLQELQEAL